MYSRFRSFLHVNKTLACTLETPEDKLFLRIVRWKMRRWAPKNASKIYYVREPTPKDPDEMAELQERTNTYNTYLRALKPFFRQEKRAKSALATSKSVLEEQRRLFALQMDINKHWNVETNIIRKARQAKEAVDKQEQLVKDIAAVEEKERLAKEEAVLLVEAEKEKSKYFINADNLDEEIEKVLAARVNYNFAMDSEGKKHPERSDGLLDIHDKKDKKKADSSLKVDIIGETLLGDFGKDSDSTTTSNETKTDV